MELVNSMVKAMSVSSSTARSMAKAPIPTPLEPSTLVNGKEAANAKAPNTMRTVMSPLLTQRVSRNPSTNTEHL